MHRPITTQRHVFAATATLSALIVVSPAMAATEIRDLLIAPAPTQFDNPPNLTMEHDGSTYHWANKGENFRIRFRVRARVKAGKVFNANANINNIGIWETAAGHHPRKFDITTSTTIGTNVLHAYEATARNACNQYGADKKVVRNLNLPMLFSVSSFQTTKQMQAAYPGKIVCMPKKGPKRVPPTALKVSKVKLYTAPAKPKCGKPVMLVTEIWSNRPGKVDFMLFRGDGAKQNASVTTRKVNGGVAALWSKTYTFDKSVDRKYMVVVKGHEFSTDWVPVKLNCGYVKDHGGKIGNLSGGQSPTN